MAKHDELLTDFGIFYAGDQYRRLRKAVEEEKGMCGEAEKDGPMCDIQEWAKIKLQT